MGLEGLSARGQVQLDDSYSYTEGTFPTSLSQNYYKTRRNQSEPSAWTPRMCLGLKGNAVEDWDPVIKERNAESSLVSQLQVN